jgi:hypothetical protein
MRLPKLLKPILVAAALALVALPVSAAAADSSGPVAANEGATTDQLSALAASFPGAENKRTMFLRFPTNAGDQACVSRDIYLAADTYRWQQVHFPPLSAVGFGSVRDIYFAAGWYHWKDCVIAIGQGGYSFYHDTYLRQESTGGYAHLPRTRFGSAERGTYSVEFGSNLIGGY